MSILQILVILSFVATLLYAAYTDFKCLEISNRASLYIALAFIPASLLAQLPLIDIGIHYACGLGFLAAGAGLFAKGLIGGGDVKLLAAVVVWFEPIDLIWLSLYISIIGGILAILMVFAQKKPAISRLLGSPVWLVTDSGVKQPIPYGIAISLAAIILVERSPVLPPSMQALLNG